MYRRDLLYDLRIFGRHAIGPTEDFGEVQGLHRDACLLKELFAITNGVKRSWSCANGTNSGTPQSLDYAAGAGKVTQVLPKRL